MKITSRKQFAQASLALMAGKPLDSRKGAEARRGGDAPQAIVPPARPPETQRGSDRAAAPQEQPLCASAPLREPDLYQLVRQAKDDVQGALDYAAPGPRQDLELSRKLLRRVRDRIGEALNLSDSHQGSRHGPEGGISGAAPLGRRPMA